MRPGHRQGQFKNGSRRREEADFRPKNTAASLPWRLRLLRRFLNTLGHRFSRWVTGSTNAGPFAATSHELGDERPVDPIDERQKLALAFQFEVGMTRQEFLHDFAVLLRFEAAGA